GEEPVLHWAVGCWRKKAAPGSEAVHSGHQRELRLLTQSKTDSLIGTDQPQEQKRSTCQLQA
ncbi:MAG TPA: hypothetical protein VEC99_10125, partial [Clostridia bacterium]|nr:hypothetical protein [Clostridia bacterium]